MGVMPWDGVVGLVKDVIDKIFPDKTQAEAAKSALLQAQLAGQLKEQEDEWQNALAQLEVDKSEAANQSLFVSGWRPFIGWSCGAAFAWVFVLQPMLAFMLAAAGRSVALPALDLSQMMPVLLGMLGLGAMRTYERVQGVPTKGAGHG